MREIIVELNSESINKAIAKLEQISTDLGGSSATIIQKLLEIGISTAMENTGKYAGYIKFEPVIQQDENGYVGLLVASDNSKIISRYWRYGSLVEAEVSPLLMAEFGSGNYADVAEIWSDLVGQVGQGTFPNQTHAFQESWRWYGLDKIWHESSGESPSYPMYSAWQEMKRAIEGVLLTAMGTV
jgi:hypothetical protein